MMATTYTRTRQGDISKSAERTNAYTFGAQFGRFAPTHGPLGPTISGFKSDILVAPIFRIVLSISSFKTAHQLILLRDAL